MQKIIIVTGGAGFVGSNLIEYLNKNTKRKILSIDNYSSGKKNNHIKSNRIKYINADTNDIYKILAKYKKKIEVIFHFGEFARIHQSFFNIKDCFHSNISGTSKVFSFCLDNKIKVIYSATSASLGNKGSDQSLSPYAYSKSRNLKLLMHLKKWFNLSFEALYFYNVYGPRQIKTGSMATVVGIFENQYEKKKLLTVVRPGSQSRKFTHVHDTVKGCYFAWKKNLNRHYSLSNNKSYSILSVAKMFSKKIKFLPPRKGERYASALTTLNLSKKIFRTYGKINLKDYVKDFVKNSKK